MTLWSEEKTCDFFREELGVVDLSGVRANGVNGKVLLDLVTSQRPWQDLEKMMLPINQVCSKQCDAAALVKHEPCLT